MQTFVRQGTRLFQQRLCVAPKALAASALTAASGVYLYGKSQNCASCETPTTITTTTTTTSGNLCKGRILRREALLLGSSNTQYGFIIEEGKGPGWGCILADKFSRKVDMINRGYSGYNTRKMLAILPIVLGEVRREKLLFATLWLGANDSAPLNDDPLCSGVPLGEYKQNLKEIGAELKAIAETVVIIGPGPVDTNGSGAFGRTLDNTRKYAEASQQVAAELGVEFVDTFGGMIAHGEAEWKAMLCDGLHFNTNGNAFIAKALLETLAPEITPDTVPWDLPGWRDLDRDDPASSLQRDKVQKMGCRNCIDVVEPLKS